MLTKPHRRRLLKKGPYRHQHVSESRPRVALVWAYFDNHPGKENWAALSFQRIYEDVHKSDDRAA